jgi:DNA-binding Lrp family transcriptional regulator
LRIFRLFGCKWVHAELVLNRAYAIFHNRGIRMVLGVILVKVAPGHERSVFAALKELPGFRELHHVFGEYDFLVIAEVDSLPVLSTTVDKIRDVEGVASTHTIVGAELADSSKVL